MAGSDRTAGLGVSLSRLERAHHAECYAPNSAVPHPRRRTAASCASSTTTRRSASTSARRCCPGWKTNAPRDLLGMSSTPTAKVSKRFSGHGSAIAQAYNHMIMPLANQRDKQTQIVWGIRDFERRFGRKPEGMWLPETAVDIETLEILAEHGIRFTILAPYQAGASPPIARRISGATSSGAKIDPTTRLPAASALGPHHQSFFYDGPISRAVAFEGLLDQRRELRQPPDWRLLGRAALAAAGAHRHRRRNLRPPSSLTARWRWPTRSTTSKQEAGEAHQLRRIPGAASRRLTKWRS